MNYKIEVTAVTGDSEEVLLTTFPKSFAGVKLVATIARVLSAIVAHMVKTFIRRNNVDAYCVALVYGHKTHIWYMARNGNGWSNEEWEVDDSD